MSDAINTHYHKQGYASADEIELRKTASTRTVFRPGIHGGGVRESIVRQKIGTDGEFRDANDADFRVLAPDTGVSVVLDTDATSKLYEKLTHLYEIQRQGTLFKTVIPRRGCG